jgi:peptidoglycan/LPS O-acetylase OafA/YrhL
VSAAAPQVGAPSPAVAPPPGNPRFAHFDSLRGIAVLSVVTFHVFGITGLLRGRVLGDTVAILGPQAPIVFFGISGFLLYRPYVAAKAAGRPSPSLTRYARRRVLRIVPAYWLALTVLAVFPGIVGVFGGDWWRYYFFVQGYWTDSFAGGIPVGWTLCVEAAFYVALPFWAMAMRRLGLELAPLTVVAVGGVLVQIAAAHNDVADLTASTLLGQCTWLALGMALAVASVAAERARHEPHAVRFVVRRPGVCWLGAGFALAALVIVLRSDWVFARAATFTAQAPVLKTALSIALSALVSALLLAPAVFGEDAGGLPRRVLATAPLAWIGVISYSIYLWHLPVAELLGVRRDPAHFSAHGLDLATKAHHFTTPILFALTLAVTLVIAGLSYRFVELPFLRRKER